MNRALVETIHIEAACLSTTRFFRPPSRFRDFGWSRLGDMSAALARSLRRAFATELCSSDWSRDDKTAATSDGIATIIPHHQIQRLIYAVTQVTGGRT